MADVTVKVLEPAASYALLTVDELKVALGIAPADTSQDALLQLMIDQYSDVIATMCKRVFAKEKVTETWRGDPPPYERNRIYLTHYPVADADIETVSSPDGTVIDAANYEIENATGKLSLAGSSAANIVVTYTGGYDTPTETPPALKAATQLMIQGARAQAARDNTGIRAVQHGESRVEYFGSMAYRQGRRHAGINRGRHRGQSVDVLYALAGVADGPCRYDLVHKLRERHEHNRLLRRCHASAKHRRCGRGIAPAIHRANRWQRTGVCLHRCGHYRQRHRCDVGFDARRQDHGRHGDLDGMHRPGRA